MSEKKLEQRKQDKNNFIIIMVVDNEGYNTSHWSPELEPLFKTMNYAQYEILCH